MFFPDSVPGAGGVDRDTRAGVAAPDFARRGAAAANLTQWSHDARSLDNQTAILLQPLAALPVDVVDDPPTR